MDIDIGDRLQKPHAFTGGQITEIVERQTDFAEKRRAFTRIEKLGQ